MSDWEDDGVRSFISVAERKQQLAKVRQRLEREGCLLSPVEIKGRKIAKSFWGVAWNRHMEQFQDYASRLAPGRSYVLQGAVLDLHIGRGEVTALVMGENLYHITIRIDPINIEQLARLRHRCAGKLGAWLDLINGELSEELIGILCDPDDGVFPQVGEIHLSCDCPDWADLCKHLAATLYAVGARLDNDPGLLFVLRGIARETLFEADLSRELPTRDVGGLTNDELGAAFGIDLEY